MSLLHRIKRAFRGEPQNPEASAAVESSRESLLSAVSGSTKVHDVVTRASNEGGRNHFIELLYANSQHISKGDLNGHRH